MATNGCASRVRGFPALSAATRVISTSTSISNKTSASSAETQGGGALPPGFDPSSNIDVKKGSTAADLPGKIGP